MSKPTEGIPPFVCEGVKFECWTMPDGTFEWRAAGGLAAWCADYVREQDPKGAPGDRIMVAKYAARAGARSIGATFSTLRGAMTAAAAAARKRTAA